MTKIEREDNGSQGRFVIYENDQFAGALTYSREGKSELVIDHTSVEEDFSGKGFGKKLIMESVKYARKNGLKILPLCSFARKVLEADEEFKDVLVSPQR